MKKLLVAAVLACFILCFIPATASAKEQAKQGKEQYVYPEDEETGEMAGGEKGAEELDLGEPTEEEMSEMDRESEWRDEEEDDYSTFDGDTDGSTQAMQDF